MRVQGTFHAIWILTPVSYEQIGKCIEVDLSNKQEKVFPDGQFYLFWELGKEYDCGPSWGSLFRNSFFEAKCSIPGLLYQPLGENHLVTLKSAILMDNYINMQASRYLHSLDTYYTPKFKFTEKEYEIILNDKKLSVEFDVSKKQIIEKIY